MSLRVGVDVGGTFTDFCCIDVRTGELRVFKRPSTPKDQSEGLSLGLCDLLRREAREMNDVTFLAHGSTVATNALLEQKCAAVGLLTTEGFRDLLELGRQVRPDIYDSSVDKPPLLVPGPWRLEIHERTSAKGELLVELDESQARRMIAQLKQEGAQALAVCLLHSYINPKHEQRLRELIGDELPDAYVSLSSEVICEFREFERFSSTVLNSALGPVIRRYLRGLDTRTAKLGLSSKPQIMQSNGGLMSIAQAEALPVSLLLSGPAAGVSGAVHVARQSGHHDIITFDMGGTSTDVSLVRRGRLVYNRLRKLAGYEIKLPMVDVHSIGAGGGSIARADAGGFIHVGPASAGAVPGPACYGAGGELPTVTDANVLTGRLGPEGLLGGAMQLQPQRAERAIAQHVARQVGSTAVDAALGILAMVNATMLGAIRRISVERGHDPRRFTLVAFGGAGPLHAAELARALGIPKILVPEHPGVLSALGLLVSDVRTEFSTTRVVPTSSASMETVRATVESLGKQAQAWLAQENVPSAGRQITFALDMRYAGQNHELTVPLPNKVSWKSLVAQLQRRFAILHREVYGHGEVDETEIVTIRAIASGKTRRRRFRAAEATDRTRKEPRYRTVHFGAGKGVLCPVFDRAQLRTGQALAGPAIIEQMDTTTLVLHGQRAQLDSARNIVITEAS